MIKHARPAVAMLALQAVALVLFCPAGLAEEIREFNGRTMGTTYMVKVAGAKNVADDDIRFRVDGELRRVNDQMSTYLKSSEISQFNASTTTDWFPVSKDFAFVVHAAQEISAKTGGAFDVTVAPLVNAWNFGTSERTGSVPDAKRLAELRAIVGYKKIVVRLDPPAIKKAIAEVQLDLSAIAKGHGVDRVVALLKSMGIQNAFVEVGGEVRTMGEKPDGQWRVGIQMPDVQRNAVLIAHPMPAASGEAAAMATSGDYRNYFVSEGKRYSHTIDPRTAAPVDHNLASVTVVAPTCMEADAWATAITVLGPEAGKTLAEQEGLSSFLISRIEGAEGVTYESSATGALKQYAKQSDATAIAVPQADSEEPGFLAAILPIGVISFVVFSILLFAMAIGVIFGRKSIGGSCGGIASQTGEDGSTSCALCSSPSDACRELREKMAASQSSD